MRIAVWHNLPSGGGKRALYDHVRGLVARGHHVEAWCPPTASRSYLPLADLVEEHVVPLRLERNFLRRGLRRLRVPSPEPSIQRAMTAHARSVAEDIGGRFDVILAAPCQLLSIPRVAQYSPLPAVLYLQEPNRSLYEASFRPDFARGDEQPTLPWLGSRPERRRATEAGRNELAAIKSFDRVLVNSYFSRESVLRAFGVTSHVCYLGVDTTKFRPHVGDVSDHIIGIGALVPEKRIELALAAVARLRPRRRLIWVGNHVYSDTYLTRLVSAATEFQVNFAPLVMATEPELLHLVATASAMIYAPRLEPFGLAPLEANACGVAVAGGAEGGVRETIIDGVNGLLVDPRPDTLAVALNRLLADSSFATDIRSSAHRHVVERWGMEAANHRLEQHLRTVTAGQPPSGSGRRPRPPTGGP